MTARGDEGGSRWLTIVTVVKDDAVGLDRTAASVRAQALEGTEWVVVDSSAEHDLTGEIVDRAGHPDVQCVWVEPRGVYAAMNEGLARANGDYVHFLNAGDEYASADAVTAVRKALALGGVTWLYGQVMFVSESGREVIPAPFDYRAEKASCFSRGRFPPHQGTVVSTTALRAAGGFDESYRIVADYAAVLRLSQVADPVELDAVIARFHEGGISTTQWRESIGEFHRARVSILQPTGKAAVRERVETATQFAKMGVARVIRRYEWSGQ